MFGSSANNSPDESPGVGSRIFVTLFGVVFLGAGLLVGCLFLRDAAAGLQTRTWRKTPCEITASAIRQENQEGQQTGNFIFDLKYRYTYGGQLFSSEKYSRNPESSEDYGDIARLTERYPPGSSAACYVNPSVPSQAVLVRYNLLMLLMLFFPLPFVGIGAMLIYSSWFHKSAAKLAAQPVSARAAPPQRLWLAVVFSLFFLLIGSAALYFAFLRPAFKIMSAKSWPAVPCVVISSEVNYHSGSHGGAYSVNIFYTYEIKGREFKSNTYDFAGGSDSGDEGKQAVVARYPRGAKAVCYVNPDDPTDAVLERGFIPQMWWGLLALPFVAIGAGGLIPIIVKGLRRAVAGHPAVGRGALEAGPARAVPSFPSGNVPASLVLKPEATSRGMFFAMLFVCLFWNGIVSVFLSHAVDSWRAGHPEWGLMIFMIPFVGIGLGLVATVLYWFVALFDPRPHLIVTPGAVPLGGTLQVQWNLTGRAGILQNLRLHLEGREETERGSGKRSETAASIFARVDIADVTTPREIRSGEASVTVPASLVPSLAGLHNKIIWTLHVHGQIAHWPDVDEQFPVTVLPSAPAAPPAL